MHELLEEKDERKKGQVDVRDQKIMLGN